MSWSDSLIRIAGYEVEMLQKRLAEIADRQVQARAFIVRLEAEAEAEEAAALGGGVYSALAHASYVKAWRGRREQAQAELARIDREAEGARDALNEAFETQKKYEHVAELAALARKRELARRADAALDELGLRRRRAAG